MTIAEARAIANGAATLGEALEPPRSQVKDHGPNHPRTDPVRYAWEKLNKAPFPSVLLTRAEEVEL